MLTSGKESIRKALANFQDCNLIITIEKKKKRRSSSQNAYFHGCVLPIIQGKLLELGFNEAQSAEWVKDFVKYNCLIQEFVSEHGEVVKSLGKTSGLTTSEFAEMIERVQQWAAEKLDCYVPNPNEQVELL